MQEKRNMLALCILSFTFHRRIIGCDTARFLSFFLLCVGVGGVGLLLDYALAFHILGELG